MAGLLTSLFKRTGKKQPKQDLQPALIRAVRARDVAAVGDLVERGADVNARFDGGITVLHIASSVGDMDMVKTLIGKGADVNARCDKNTTPLHWAAMGGYSVLARCLIEAGAAIDIRDSRYNATPEGWAMREGRAQTALDIAEYFSLWNSRRVAAMRVGSRPPQQP